MKKKKDKGAIFCSRSYSFNAFQVSMKIYLEILLSSSKEVSVRYLGIQKDYYRQKEIVFSHKVPSFQM